MLPGNLCELVLARVCLRCFCVWCVSAPQLSSLRECLRQAEAERDCLEVVLKELGGVRLSGTTCRTDDMLDFPGESCFPHQAISTGLIQIYYTCSPALCCNLISLMSDTKEIYKTIYFRNDYDLWFGFSGILYAYRSKQAAVQAVTMHRSRDATWQPRELILGADEQCGAALQAAGGAYCTECWTGSQSAGVVSNVLEVFRHSRFFFICGSVTSVYGQ